MKPLKSLALACMLAGATLTGCASTTSPATLGEQIRQEGSYGYTPIDPLPIAGERMEDVLSLLPDTTMRLAIGSFDAQGNLTYGPVKMGIAGNRYQVVMDYIEYTTMSIPVSVKDITPAGSKKKEFSVDTLPMDQEAKADKIIPVYVGVGLRLTASITALKDNVDLSNLVAIGVAASNNQVHGTLTVQAMGISGEAVADMLPMPSTLDQSTVQQALMALGNIKSKSYAKDKTIITPRVLAVYNPFNNSGPQTVSGLISLIIIDQSNLILRRDGHVPTTQKSNDH